MSFVIEQSSPPAATINVVLTNVPCDPAVIVTDAVKMVAGVAFQALADSITNSNVIGVVQKKSSATVCDIRVSGVTPAIFAGLDESREYVLSGSTPGLLVTQDFSPTGAGQVILRVGQPFDSQRLLVSKGTRIIRS